MLGMQHTRWLFYRRAAVKRNKDPAQKCRAPIGVAGLFLLLIASSQIGETRSKSIQGLVQWGGPYYSPYILVVDKGKKQVSLWRNEKDSATKFLTFNSDVGKIKGDKFKKGDFKTPEGIYFFTQQFVGKQLTSYKLYGSLAFDTDYPNFFDRQKGKTGAGIWLHGLPNDQALDEGSRGCVALRDRDIHILKGYIHLRRTPFLIYDSVPMVDPSEVRRLRTKLNQMVQEWEHSWENKQLDVYMGFYDSTFRSQKKNWNQWRTYKQGLMEKYQFIRLTLTQPLILHHPSGVVVKTIQRYESNGYKDLGEKTLYLVQKEKEFKIIGEEWKPLYEKSLLPILSRKEKLNLHSLKRPTPSDSKTMNGISLQTDMDKE